MALDPAHDRELRQQLVALLTVRQAHADFEDAIADFPEEHINTRPPGSPYSFWHLLEHMRLAQRDLVDYIEAERYDWPTFPDSYWPAPDATADAADWERSVAQFRADRGRMVELVRDPSVDLYAPLPNSGERGHNLLREIHIGGAHNAYHTGAMIMMRQALGIWR